MFVSVNENMITYKIQKYESVDKLAFEMLNKTSIPGLFIIGRDGAELKIPVCDSQPLVQFLQENSGLYNVANVIKQATAIIESKDKYFLDGATIILRIDLAYVVDNKLMLVCIPCSYAVDASQREEDFIRSIISAAAYAADEYEKVFELLNVVNQLNYSSEKLLMKLEELVPPSRHDVSNKQLDDIEQGNPKHKRFSLVELLHRFFIVDNTTESNDQENQLLVFNEELPQGVNVITVRGSEVEYPLGFGPDIIGTEVNLCSICFPSDKRLSKEHCEIRFERGRYIIEDLGSENGTKVNGTVLISHKVRTLSSGDLISAGSQELVFSHRVGI